MALFDKAFIYVQFDDLEGLKTIVPSQVDPNALSYSTTNHLHTLLQCACSFGAEKCAEYLLENGANPMKKNFTGFTPLHWAAYSGRTETVKMLIANGANLNARNEDGQTPIHVAASRGHLQFIKFILEEIEDKDKKADIDSVTSDGWTALHFAVIGNHQPVVKYLLSKKIDFSGPDINMKTIHSLVDEYGRNWFNDLIPIE